jgi:hypothetical protein
MSFIKEYANEQEYELSGMNSFGLNYTFNSDRRWAIDRERNMFAVNGNGDRFNPSIYTYIYFYKGFFLKVNLEMSGAGKRGAEGLTKFKFNGFIVAEEGEEKAFFSQMEDPKDVWNPFKEVVTLLTIDLECFTKHLIEFDF